MPPRRDSRIGARIQQVVAGIAGNLIRWDRDLPILVTTLDQLTLLVNRSVQLSMSDPATDREFPFRTEDPKLNPRRRATTTVNLVLPGGLQLRIEGGKRADVRHAEACTKSVVDELLEQRVDAWSRLKRALVEAPVKLDSAVIEWVDLADQLQAEEIPQWAPEVWGACLNSVADELTRTRRHWAIVTRLRREIEGPWDLIACTKEPDGSFKASPLGAKRVRTLAQRAFSSGCVQIDRAVGASTIAVPVHALGVPWAVAVFGSEGDLEPIRWYQYTLAFERVRQTVRRQLAQLLEKLATGIASVRDTDSSQFEPQLEQAWSDVPRVFPIQPIGLCPAPPGCHEDFVIHTDLGARTLGVGDGAGSERPLVAPSASTVADSSSPDDSQLLGYERLDRRSLETELLHPVARRLKLVAESRRSLLDWEADLWSTTGSWFSQSTDLPHNLPDDGDLAPFKARVREWLERLWLAPAPPAWFDDDRQFRFFYKSLQGLCGAESCVVRGTYNIRLGNLPVLLGIAMRCTKVYEANQFSELLGSIRWSQVKARQHVVPAQSPGTARQSITWLVNDLLVPWLKDTSDGGGTLRSVVLTDDRLQVDLEFRKRADGFVRSLLEKSPYRYKEFGTLLARRDIDSPIGCQPAMSLVANELPSGRIRVELVCVGSTLATTGDRVADVVVFDRTRVRGRRLAASFARLGLEAYLVDGDRCTKAEDRPEDSTEWNASTDVPGHSKLRVVHGADSDLWTDLEARNVRPTSRVLHYSEGGMPPSESHLYERILRPVTDEPRGLLEVTTCIARWFRKGLRDEDYPSELLPASVTPFPVWGKILVLCEAALFESTSPKVGAALSSRNCELWKQVLASQPGGSIDLDQGIAQHPAALAACSSLLGLVLGPGETPLAVVDEAWQTLRDLPVDYGSLSDTAAEWLNRRRRLMHDVDKLPRRIEGLMNINPQDTSEMQPVALLVRQWEEWSKSLSQLLADYETAMSPGSLAEQVIGSAVLADGGRMRVRLHARWVKAHGVTEAIHAAVHALRNVDEAFVRLAKAVETQVGTEAPAFACKDSLLKLSDALSNRLGARWGATGWPLRPQTV